MRFMMCLSFSSVFRCVRVLLVENRVLRGLFGRKRNEETGGWRKLHYEELHDLYSSPCVIRIIKSRRLRWAGHMARVGEKRNAYRILVGKPEGNKSQGRHTHSWEDNSKMGSTQLLTEMNTRNLPGGKWRPAHKADNLTAICELIF
jgi:hypothetical protein